MARPICLWLPSLAVLALSACSGTESGFFSNVIGAGAGGSSQAGASSFAGALPSAGAPSFAGSAGLAGSAGQGQAGIIGSGGAPTAGASAGGLAGSNGGGTAGALASAGAGGTLASAGQAGASGASAGAGGANAELSCSELIKLGTQQLDAARVCNAAVDDLQCTGRVTNRCNCQVAVQKNDSPETKAYLETLKRLDAKNCAPSCATVECALVNKAQCRQSGPATTGMCVGTNSGPAP